MSAASEARARRKEELRLLARIERMELASHLADLKRLRKPANFALIGARIFKAWRNPAWMSTAAALLASRGLGNDRVMRGLRYAGIAFAAWRTWRLVRDYTSHQRSSAKRATDA